MYDILASTHTCVHTHTCIHTHLCKHMHAQQCLVVNWYDGNKRYHNNNQNCLKLFKKVLPNWYLQFIAISSRNAVVVAIHKRHNMNGTHIIHIVSTAHLYNSNINTQTGNSVWMQVSEIKCMHKHFSKLDPTHLHLKIPLYILAAQTTESIPEMNTFLSLCMNT